ncbi:helicase-related protein [Cellulomonas sp. NPDC089187]|uniref:type I-G CRISPR-associated helicase/endonuclease Cas3g n=1 Tax=Cellulomonas sp. NPDC089187 TaxID=3154970 RepID=UPI00341ABCF0
MTEFPDFAAFFSDVHGFDPYPWQRALADRVQADRRWPDTVQIPTGLGKTACIDVAIWDLARQLDERAHLGMRRTAPLRIIHVVDRRSIIDQTGGHLQTLARAVGADPQPGSPSHRVGHALRGSADPTSWSVSFETQHALSPDGDAWLRGHHPAVVSTTPHQFVSRLLFRGFGVSAGMAPVHAALTGVDRLVLFDEPHLSEAAIQTIQSQQDHQQSFGTPLGDVPVGQLVLLGASLPPHLRDLGQAHGLSEADHHDPRERIVIRARRDVELCPSVNTDASVRGALVKAAQHSTSDKVLVFCNTVAMAQEVEHHLNVAEPGCAIVLTSRFRPHDRARLDAALSDWAQTAMPSPRIVVATQTLEAGIDVSAGAVITEACPWPALQQRVGRLNRRGEYGSATVTVVTGIRPGTQAIYDREATQATLDLLKTLPGLDLASQRDVDTAGTWGPRTFAPTLHAGILPVLAHTRPRPVADIDPVPFIVGRHSDQPAADVRVAWRTVVDGEALTLAHPRPDEIIEVPVSAARSLARHAITGTDSDADFGDASLSADGSSSDGSPLGDRPAPWWYDGEQWRPVTHLREISPDSVVVFPVNYGGYSDTRGWDPHSRQPVTDLAGLGLESGAPFFLSRDSVPALKPTADPADLRGVLRALDLIDLEIADEPGAVPDLDELGTEVAALLGLDPAMIEIDSASGDAYVVRVAHTTGSPRSAGAPVSLVAHSRDVAQHARRTAEAVGLPPHLHMAVEQAAYHHDDGKSWPAFQRFLHSTVRQPAGQELLAKSGAEDLSWTELRQAQLRAGVPPYWRHEARSAQRLITECNADDLVVHLVASHHGWSRPLIPPVVDPADPGVDANQVDGSPERFDTLNRRFGPWGLAFLESIVRLADHAASAAPTLDASEPASALPTNDHDDATPPARADSALTGLPLDTPLAWWAAFGTLVAAHRLDAESTLRWEWRSGVRIPVVRSAASLGSIAHELAQVTDYLADASALVPSLRRKNQKIPMCEATRALAQLDLTRPGHRIVAAVVSDSIIDAIDKKKDGPAQELAIHRSLFIPNNSNGFASALSALDAWRNESPADALFSLLTNRHDPRQYGGTQIHGLAENQVNQAMRDGLSDDQKVAVRSLALLPVAYGMQSLTAGAHSILGIDGRDMSLPVISKPTTLPHLIALLRTVPRIESRPWNLDGVEELTTYHRTTTSYFSTYAHRRGTSYA